MTKVFLRYSVLFLISFAKIHVLASIVTASFENVGPHVRYFREIIWQLCQGMACPLCMNTALIAAVPNLSGDVEYVPYHLGYIPHIS